MLARTLGLFEPATGCCGLEILQVDCAAYKIPLAYQRVNSYPRKIHHQHAIHYGVAHTVTLQFQMQYRQVYSCNFSYVHGYNYSYSCSCSYNYSGTYS